MRSALATMSGSEVIWMSALRFLRSAARARPRAAEARLPLA
jgi:hypothetical protein